MLIIWSDYYFTTRTLETPSIAFSSSSASLDAALFQINESICVFAFALVCHICDVQTFCTKDLGKLADHVRDIFVADGDTSYCYAGSHVAVREVYRVLDISVLEEISDFFYSHYRTVFFGFFCRCSKVWSYQDSLMSCYCMVCKVCHIFLYFFRCLMIRSEHPHQPEDPGQSSEVLRRLSSCLMLLC